MKLINAFVAMEACALALDDGNLPEYRGDEALALYGAAAAIEAACISVPMVQVDGRIPLPDWLVDKLPSAEEPLEVGSLVMDPEKETTLDLRETFPRTTRQAAEIVARVWATEMLLNDRPLRPTVAVLYNDVAGEPCIVRVPVPDPKEGRGV